MYNRPYFIPGYYAPPTLNMMRNVMPFTRGVNNIRLMGRLGNSFSWFKNINWGGIINGASRTLGIVNQTIPLVKQVGPVFNNVRSMFRIMSAFRDETIPRNKSIIDNKPQEKSSNLDNNYHIDNNSPTFFNI